MSLSGQIAYYSIILGALLWHEAGHLLTAKLCRVKVKSCVIAPYGGEIEFENPAIVNEKSLLWIALGGPIATLIGIGFAFFMPELIAIRLINVQLVLLIFNLLPILPLDGGRIVIALLYIFYPSAKAFEIYHSLSLFFVTVLLLMTLNHLPQSLFIVVLCFFMWLQVIKEWNYRKYRLAFEKYVMHRLT